MNELKTTQRIAGAAIVLGLLAFATTPGRVAPDAFFDVGEPFFPAFTDPEAAATLEVIEFDEDTASATPFKVTNRGGLWTIPSHHDYPADGEERLANAAADVISVIKDDFRSDNVADHDALGVVDPTDETVSTLQGRGTRVTFRDPDERVLADLIVGRAVPGRPGLRFVRVPDQKRVYTARFEADISTAFEDWIETNLLEVERDQVQQITLNEYFIDEQTLSVVRRGEFVLTRNEADGWDANELPEGQEVDAVQVNLLVGAVMTMNIAGVRPKPPGLSGNVREASTRPPRAACCRTTGSCSSARTRACSTPCASARSSTAAATRWRWATRRATTRRRAPARTATSSSRPTSTRRPSPNPTRRMPTPTRPGSGASTRAARRPSSSPPASPTGTT